MLTTEKYISLFTEHFNDNAKTPLDYKSDVLTHALQFRENGIPPFQAARWSIRFIEDKEAFLSTPIGHQFQKQILSKEKHLYENLSFIETWPKHELIALIRLHIDISEVTNDWLLQFREDLDLLV